jgi:AcrR family transcriptional regulator
MTLTDAQPAPEVGAGQPPVLPPKARSGKRYPSGGRVPSLRALKSEAELRRQGIRQTAAKMFAEQGIRRVTMHELAQATHLSGESLCLHYSNCEELLVDIMVRHLDILMRLVCDAYDQTAPEAAVKRLQEMIGAFLAAALDERNEHRLIVRSSDVLDEKGQVSVAGRYRSLATLFAEVLEASMPNVTAASAMVAAMSLLTTLSGAALWFRDDGAIGPAAYAQMLTEAAMTMARPSLCAA